MRKFESNSTKIVNYTCRLNGGGTDLCEFGSQGALEITLKTQMNYENIFAHFLAQISNSILPIAPFKLNLETK